MQSAVRKKDFILIPSVQNGFDIPRGKCNKKFENKLFHTGNGHLEQSNK